MLRRVGRRGGRVGVLWGPGAGGLRAELAGDPEAGAFPGRFGSWSSVSSVVLAGGVGLLAFWPRIQGGPDLVALVDVLVGAAGCLALVLRRRWTTALALVLTVVSAADVSIGGAAVVATFAVAVRRRPQRPVAGWGEQRS